jgi:hypothetical protein
VSGPSTVLRAVLSLSNDGFRRTDVAPFDGKRVS